MYCRDCFYFEICKEWHDGVCSIVGHTKSFESDVACPRFKAKSEWISVEERLPEVAGRAYLVWDDVQKNVKKRFFYRIPPSIPLETYPYIREYFGNSADYKRYTHWMPLPEPPKGD